MAYSGPMTGTRAERVPFAGAHRAYNLLHVGFVVAPFVAGLDKFFEYLTKWDKYLAPQIPNLLGTGSETIMHIVGVIEMLAAVLVLFKPRIGGYVVALWMAGIIVNLVINPSSWWANPEVRLWDIVLRDMGLMFAALSLAWLARDERVSQEQG